MSLAFTPSLFDAHVEAPRRPRLGEIVGYVLNFGPRGHVGDVRSAMVVRIWDAPLGLVNLRLFTDGANDQEDAKFPLPCMEWQTGVRYEATGKRLGTWHYLDGDNV